MSDQILKIKTDKVELESVVNIPENSSKLIIFSHGSGSSRLSPRNNFVARELQKHGLATVLVDLLTPQEDQLYENRFDIDLLSERLAEVTVFFRTYPLTQTHKIGYFGASTGSASALKASIKENNDIFAIVSRGGRPDLVTDIISEVKAPVLLIVGSLDEYVLELNRKAFSLIKSKKELEVVKGATHLFEEPGTLEKVAELSSKWFIEN